MNNITFTINLKCMFCSSLLETKTDKKYVSGDLLKCKQCGEFNDYDSLIGIVTEEGKNKMDEYAQNEIDKMIKDIFK